MNAHLVASLILAAALASPAVAEDVKANEPEHPLGQHPAVIIKERSKNQPYDYAAKFYPHPAWLYLLPKAPESAMEPPADVAGRPERRDILDASASKPLPSPSR